MIERYRNLILFGIILIAISFRLYGLNWDQGYHLHPDERAIVLSVVDLQIPKNVSEFVSKESRWNPHFFAYGSFPFYVLRIVGSGVGFLLLPIFSEYGGINLVGRFLSSLFDIGTLLMLYALGKRFFTPAIGIFAAFFYAVSVLPIQLSHFYTVDTILTFFITAVIYYCIVIEEKRSIRKALLCGACFGLAIATKVSAIILLVPIAVAFLYMLINKRSGAKSLLSDDVVKRSVKIGLAICIAASIAFIIASPYALIDFHNFIQDTQRQSEMTKDAFVFPYTLQYVFKTPYVYELYNLFFFGLGPLLAIIALAGFVLLFYQTIMEKSYEIQARNLIILSFFIVYFLVVGGFKVGFMRYLLPLYPLLCLFAAILSTSFYQRFFKKVNPLILVFCSLLLALSFLIWPTSFMHVYSAPNPRVQASNWIYQNIPSGSGVAIEHWDDALPLANATRYKTYTLPLYDPETNDKWHQIHTSLGKSDYIIIASNRLYTPLMKLTDCKKLPKDRCYPRTSNYYDKLFSGKSNFQKVAEFTATPTIPFLAIPIHDESADESFTVYDHPKVMIFKRQ